MTHNRSIDIPTVRAPRRVFAFTEVLFAVMVLGIGFIMIAAMFPVTIRQTQNTLGDTQGANEAVAQSNPELKLGGQQQSIKMSQRTALATPLINPSPLGGTEQIGVYTTFLADGNLFYYLTVAQEKDLQAFQEAFRKIGQSIKLTEAR